jgi:hypothetical protein
MAPPRRGPHHAPELPQAVRAAQPLPSERPAIEHPTEVHLHLHGVSAEEVAAILNRQVYPQAAPAKVTSPEDDQHRLPAESG